MATQTDWDESYKLSGTSSSRVCTREAPSGNWIEGAIATIHGYVDAYSDDENSRLSFIWQGREYRRHMSRGYTRQGLARAATKFVEEIVSMQSNNRQTER